MAILGWCSNVSISRRSPRLRPLLWLGVLYFFCTLASAQTTTPSEQQIKAIFIYKFCLYVEWPAGTFDNASSPLTIGIVGADEIAAELELKAKELVVDGRLLVVRRLDLDSKLDNLQLLFISQTHDDKLAYWVARAQGHPLLVVTETPSGLDAGSSINFSLQDKRVRFDVALDRARRQGLKLGAQLLQVARTVREGEPP